jgi:transcriptional regulator with XRE-family HTH domain
VTRRASHSAELLEPTRVIAERVGAIRRYLGFTQEGLAEAMRGVGIEWQRIVVAKLESGRRSFVTVDELLALCVVLEISPTDLLVPKEVKDDQDYRIVPNATARAKDAREFIRGEAPLYIFPYPEPPSNPEQFFASPTGRSINSIPWMPPDRADRVDRSYYAAEYEQQRLDEQRRQEDER